MKKHIAILAILSLWSSILHCRNTKISEKPIVVIIPSYNNADCYQKNLDSLFDQKYSNWRAIYIDDVSSDGTGDLVEQYIKKNGFEHKFTVIRNTIRSLAMANLYRAIITCHDNEIIATLDGDDWFAHNQVLKLLNKIYQNPNVWLTYGSYTDWPEPEPAVLQHWIANLGGTLGNRPVPQDIIKNNNFRSFVGCTGQLRTFYTWLFKQIKLEDLMYKSQFLPMTYDVGIMIPMHEMAGGRFKYIKDIIYIHNLNTPLNDHKVDSSLQGKLEVLLRGKEKYQPLKKSRSGYFDQYKNSRADLIIFSYDRPMQLYALLESVKYYITGLNSITVIYRTSNTKFKKAYQKVHKTFPQTIFLHQKNKHNFKKLTMQALKQTTEQHIIFAVDDIIVTDHINMNECIRWLEYTQAHGFYLRLGTHLNYCYTEDKKQSVPPYAIIHNDILAWQFDHGTSDWHYPNTVDMTLYRKKELITLLASFNFTSPNWLEGRWTKYWPSRPIGLFYQHTKIVNIPINKVNEDANNREMHLYTAQELLKKFEQGLKIDIQPLYKIENKAAHMEYIPNFITRKKTRKYSEHKRYKIGLVIMATGKYIDFVKPLINSAEKYFCPQHEVTYFVFTDTTMPRSNRNNIIYINTNNTTHKSPNIFTIYQKKLGWPRDTLMRFAIYYANSAILSHMDYLFACDADMLFVDYEGDEILGKQVGTLHPGHEDKYALFSSQKITSYEKDPKSTAYIGPDEGKYYFAGGFYGGSTKEFLEMAKTITENIKIDLQKNYIAIWHDESHLNRYFVDHPPTTILDRSYCYPENGEKIGYPTCTPKLLALDKDHDEIRE